MNKLKRMLALVLCAAALSSALVMPAAAAENGTDSDKSYLVLGADLSDSQRATVLDLLGVTDAANYKEDYNVYYTTNAEEHQYLDKYLSASVIGTNSLSSIKLTARDAGKGISISTKNISYCTVEMYQNALITAGVSDVELVVAGPSNISGTAALVSAMKAYEIMTGEKLSEDSVDAANNELVVTGEVGDELGDASKAAELIAAVKNEVLANGDKDLTDDEIGAAIDRICPWQADDGGRPVRSGTTDTPYVPLSSEAFSHLSQEFERFSPSNALHKIRAPDSVHSPVRRWAGRPAHPAPSVPD